MSLQRDLQTAVSQAENGLKRCTVCMALATMSKGEQVSLRTALESPLGAKKLSAILQKNGIAVGVPSIHSHRSEGHQ